MRPRHFAFRGVSRAFRSGQTYVDLVDQARLKAQIVKVRCRERLLKALDLREPIHRMRPEAGEHLDNLPLQTIHPGHSKSSLAVYYSLGNPGETDLSPISD